MAKLPETIVESEMLSEWRTVALEILRRSIVRRTGRRAGGARGAFGIDHVAQGGADPMQRVALARKPSRGGHNQRRLAAGGVIAEHPVDSQQPVEQPPRPR
jgi:hypothetical protein